MGVSSLPKTNKVSLLSIQRKQLAGFPPSAHNVTLPAFADEQRRGLQHGARIYRSISAADVAAVCSRRCCCRWGQTDGRTDARPLHRSCATWEASVTWSTASRLRFEPRFCCAWVQDANYSATEPPYLWEFENHKLAYSCLRNSRGKWDKYMLSDVERAMLFMNDENYIIKNFFHLYA